MSYPNPFPIKSPMKYPTSLELDLDLDCCTRGYLVPVNLFRSSTYFFICGATLTWIGPVSPRAVMPHFPNKTLPKVTLFIFESYVPPPDLQNIYIQVYPLQVRVEILVFMSCIYQQYHVWLQPEFIQVFRKWIYITPGIFYYNSFFFGNRRNVSSLSPLFRIRSWFDISQIKGSKITHPEE